jgi:two-component system, cell cycle response regulator
MRKRAQHTHPKRAESREGSRATSAPPGNDVRSIQSPKGLAFLAKLATEFTAVLSLPDLLERVMQVLREETGFDSCGVALLDAHDPDTLRIRATSGSRNRARGEVFRRGEGLGWAVINAGAPLIVPDMHADPRVHRRHPELRSSILAPLLVQRRPIGVLAVYRATPDAFTEGELSLLTVVARYLAGAIEVARLHEQLKELAATDSLTGLANRRAFLGRLQAEIARSRRSHAELCIVLLDLNHFKTVNDVYGHATGDQVLIRMAEALNQTVRRSDLAARFGGDEFILLIPGTNRREVVAILDRIRGVPIFVPDPSGTQVRLSFAWGLATWPHDGGDPEELLQAADRRLYAMKRSFEVPPPRPRSDSKASSDV